MIGTDTVRVTVWLTSHDTEAVARAAEAFARTAAGFALDGIEVTLTIGPDPEDE